MYLVQLFAERISATKSCGFVDNTPQILTTLFPIKKTLVLPCHRVGSVALCNACTLDKRSNLTMRFTFSARTHTGLVHVGAYTKLHGVHTRERARTTNQPETIAQMITIWRVRSMRNARAPGCTRNSNIKWSWQLQHRFLASSSSSVGSRCRPKRPTSIRLTTPSAHYINMQIRIHTQHTHTHAPHTHLNALALACQRICSVCEYKNTLEPHTSSN